MVDYPDSEWKQPYAAEFDIDDWQAFRAHLTGMGYAPGYGPRRGLIDGQSIDAQVARAAVCQTCGKSCSYQAVHVLHDHSKEYRAFAVCYACNKAIEF
jgi:hypothetical protein